MSERNSDPEKKYGPLEELTAIPVRRFWKQKNRPEAKLTV
jgi:hypothetical protein